ncbi:MAG TPA: cytochrome c [Steroidobacteraceae bacterium]|nr:cytochrome c [Steroidobacteraceae bacterium]
MLTAGSATRLCAALAAAILAGGAVRAAQAQDLSSYESGAGLYRAHCASCHGAGGHGDGPVAASLKVEVPDLTRIARRQGGRFPADRLRRIIDGRTTVPPHGTRTMPVWGLAFGSPQQSNRLADLLVQYLLSIQE